MLNDNSFLSYKIDTYKPKQTQLLIYIYTEMKNTKSSEDGLNFE